MWFGYLYVKLVFEFVNEFDLWLLKYLLDLFIVKS